MFMALLQVENNLDQLETTQSSNLSTNINAGASTIPVKNINIFFNQWAQQLGKTGEQQSEIVTIYGSPSGTAFNTLGTTIFSHPIDTPIYQIHYDSIIFKKSSAGTVVAATALSTVSITPSAQFTEYNDISGVVTDAYKTQFYNSVSGDLSSESDWFIPGGPTFYSLQKLRQRGKDALYNADFIKSDSIIDDWINEWGEQMTNKALKVDKAYSIGTAAYAIGTAGLGTVTEPLFKYASKIEVTFDGINYTNSTEIPVHSFSSSDGYSSLNPRHYWNGDTVFGILPNGDSGTVRMTLGKLQSNLVNDTDELPQYLRGYTTGCIEYILYRAYDNDQKRDYANDHYGKFNKNQNDFISEITPRDFSGPKTIDFTEGLSGMNDDISLTTECFI